MRMMRTMKVLMSIPMKPIMCQNTRMKMKMARKISAEVNTVMMKMMITIPEAVEEEDLAEAEEVAVVEALEVAAVVTRMKVDIIKIKTEKVAIIKTKTEKVAERVITVMITTEEVVTPVMKE
jgi:hypothetical protein